MIESNLVAGRQDVLPGKPLTYGQSITDGCIDWETTVSGAELVGRRGCGETGRAEPRIPRAVGLEQSECVQGASPSASCVAVSSILSKPQTRIISVTLRCERSEPRRWMARAPLIEAHKSAHSG